MLLKHSNLPDSRPRLASEVNFGGFAWIWGPCWDPLDGMWGSGGNFVGSVFYIKFLLGFCWMFGAGRRKATWEPAGFPPLRSMKSGVETGDCA